MVDTIAIVAVALIVGGLFTTASLALTPAYVIGMFAAVAAGATVGFALAMLQVGR